jgi:2'-5' RNA ligase
MKKARTFIAINPGKKIRDRLVALQEKFSREGVSAKWVEPDNIHLTLIFLGEVEMLTVPKVCKVVAEAADQIPAFPLTVEHAGCFGNPRRPRTLWVGVGEGSEEVTALHAALEEPLLDLGCYRREARPFTPHLTIGRIEGNRHDVDLSTLLAAHENWKAGETTVAEILVMGSELTPKGPIYTVLGRGKLG